MGPVAAAVAFLGRAAIPADAALSVLVGGALFSGVVADEAAGHFVELGLAFQDGVLGFGGELGLQLGIRGGEFDIDGGLLKGKEGLRVHGLVTL